MHLNAHLHMVYLKNYPTADTSANYRANGDHFVHLLVDPVDGIYRTSEENLVSYSYTETCVDVVLKMLPGFVGQAFQLPADVFSVWCEGDMICYNDETITFRDLFHSEELTYRAVLKK